MKPRKPRVGLLILIVALGSGGAGYVLRYFQDTNAGRATGRSEAHAVRVPEPALDLPYVEEAEGAPYPLDGEESADTEPREEPVAPGELLDALRRHKDSPRSQKILVGMVADAARLGSEALPEIRRLLEEGADIRFGSYEGKPSTFPSLRVALLEAAAATGDPEAARLIAEVAQTTESPVEVVFSAHMLDRLDALDPQTARRALDSLAVQLPPEQRKAMGSVLRQVVPAAARADPAYAEDFLTRQLRVNSGPRADLRMAAPVLDGLPLERARSVVLNAISAPDVHERSKMMVASRAAQRGELEMLTSLRHAIESNTLSPRVSSSIARSAMSGRAYFTMEKRARRAVKSGDLGQAQKLAKAYEARLAEAARTIAAARASGAKVPPEMNKRGSIFRERLGGLLHQLRRAHEKRLKQQQKAAGTKKQQSSR